MKPLRDSPVSLRDSALLLALLFGAGAAFPGCGDDEAPTTPGSPALPAAPAPESTLTTPENLRVTGRGPDYIEWSWNTVAGAPAYQAQFSTDDTFTPADATYLIVAPQTSHRAESLPDNTTGHLRVRSAGEASLTNRQFSDWSEAVRGATTAPAVALDTPQEVRTSDLGEDSVTLRWDPVSGAGLYEVEQREPDGDNAWGGADCEGAEPSHRVEREECIAGGLDPGTNYDFRVRAIPSDTGRHRESAWSATRETRTEEAGTRPTEPTTGAMGNLNVRWTSDGDAHHVDLGSFARGELRLRRRYGQRPPSPRLGETPALTRSTSGWTLRTHMRRAPPVR